MHRVRRFRAVRFLSVVLFAVPLLAGCASQALSTPSATPTTASAATTTSATRASSAASPATGATTAPRAAAQKGGRVVVALDQAPPTMDPQASPSAVTYEMTSTVFRDVALP